MATLKVRKFRMDSGEWMALLVHEIHGLPYEPAVQYSLRMRAKSWTLSSMSQALSAVALGLDVFADLKIDLIKRVAQRRFLSAEELIALANRCRVSEPEFGSRLVDPHYAKTRYLTCADYIKYVAEPVIARIEDTKLHDASNRALGSFQKRAKLYAPASRSHRTTVDGHLRERLGLTPIQRALYLRVITPGDLDNPYKPELQLRNQVMLRLAYDLGLRAGEILGLKGGDFDFSEKPAIVYVHRRHDDHEEHRRNPPRTKTLPRILALDDDLRDLVDQWFEVRSDRAHFPEARKHSYLCVNYKGEALSDRGFRKMVAKLPQRFPDLAPLCTHICRHDWNDRWREMNEDSIHPDEDLRDQKAAMGWSDNSSMPLRYGKRSIRDSTNRKIIRIQAVARTKVSER